VAVGYVGSLRRRHGVRTLKQLREVPGIRPVVIGDGPQLGWLRARLPDAKFTGALQTGDLARAMASLDLLVHPGTEETCSHALRQGAASGVPVVAPRSGGALAVVRPRETGLLDNPASDHDLARAVAAVAADHHRHLMGRAGRELALDRPWRVAVDELVEHHYRPLVGQARPVTGAA
jgi:phosphatidylinositol alpha 1,6-mannosyltransferase